MTFIKKSFRFLWALWAMIVWLVSLVIVSILYALIFLLAGKNAEHIAHRLSRTWALTGLTLCGIRVKVHGVEVLDPKETYIFVSNHRSQLDIPVCACSTQHFFKFLAKEELTKIPLLGLIIKRLYLTVNRGSVRDRVLSMQKMKKAVEEGTSVWIYPEGTRNKTNTPINEMQDGAFRLAIDTGKPIAIAAIIDTGRNLPSGEMFQLIPGRIDVYWAAPLPTTGMKSSDTTKLKEEAARILEELIVKHRGG